LDSIAIFAAHKIPQILPIMNIGREKERERGREACDEARKSKFLPSFLVSIRRDKIG
jgi:hypothetical protein